MRVLYYGSDTYVRRFVQAAVELPLQDVIFRCETDIAAATALLESSYWEIVVLDCRDMAPDEVPSFVRTFRKASKYVGILTLAGPRATTLDQIVALRAGADDWLVVPLPQAELTERCRTLVRRVSRFEPGDSVYSLGGLTLDASEHTLTGPRGSVTLTCNETLLLACLLRQPNRSVDRLELLRAMTDGGFAVEREQLKVGVYRVRQKLAQVGIRKSAIENRRGLGYRVRLP